MIFMPSSSRPSTARLYSAGISKRLVRSPPAPKITSVQGGAGRLPAGDDGASCGPALTLQLGSRAAEVGVFGVVDMGFAYGSYLVTAVTSAGAGSGADSVGQAGAGAEVDVGIGARSGSPAKGTLPDAPIALGCSSSATRPLQPV